MRIIGVVLITTGAALAQDFFDIPAADLPSSATLEGGGAAGARDMTFQMDFGVPSGRRIRGGYAATHADSADAGYVSDTYWAGLESDPLAAFSYGANYEVMERDDGIQSGAAKVNLRWRLNRWRIAIYPERRSITLTKTYVTQKNAVRSVATTIRSPGLGAAVAFNGLEPWSFGFRHFVYRYKTDAQTLRNHPAFTQLVTSRVDQSFDASRTNASVDYLPSWGSVGMEVTRSLSAIDRAVAQGAAVNLSWDVSRAWTVFARAGRSRADGIAATGFASAGMTWTWDE